MLLRQALEQTRAGMPAPIRFNSLRAGFEPAAEVAAMEQMIDLHLPAVHDGLKGWSLHRGSDAIGFRPPQRQGTIAYTGAHAS